MSSNKIKFWNHPIIFLILTYIISLVLSVLLEEKFEELLGKEFNRTILKIGTIIIMSSFGFWWTYLLRDHLRDYLGQYLIKDLLIKEAMCEEIGKFKNKILTEDYLKNAAKEGIREHITKIIEEAESEPFYSWLFLNEQAKEIKTLVSRLKILPKNTKTIHALIKSYAEKAQNSTFFVDFENFLELGNILAENSREMIFVNITPPYEWWDPVHFKNDRITTAIKKYRQKINEQMSNASIVKRITIVDDISALSSPLEHGFTNLLIGRETIPADAQTPYMKEILGWLIGIISRYDQDLSDESKKIAKEILNLCNDGKFEEFCTKYYPAGKFYSDFTKLSLEISPIVVRNFIGLHKPADDKNSAQFICKKSLLPQNIELIQSFTKEEGIYKDPDNNIYYLCMEETNGSGILLAKVQTLNNLEDTYFNTFESRLLKNEVEHKRGTVGSLHDLLIYEHNNYGRK